MAAYTFDCQRCGAPIMAADDMVGKRGRCPHCSTIFTIPDPHTAIAPAAMPLRVPAAPDINRTGPGWRELAVDDEPPRAGMGSAGNTGRLPRRAQDDYDDDDYDAPYDRGPRGLVHVAPGWSTVAGGMSLMRTGMIIYIIVLVVMVLFFIFALATAGGFGRGGNRQTETMMGILALMGGLVGLVSIILFIVGQCMCCAAPPDSGTKGQAVGSVICLFVGIGLGLLAFMVLVVADGRMGRGAGDGMVVMGGGMWLLTNVLFIVSHVLLAVFIRNVARYFRNQHLASSAGTYLVMLGVFVGFALLALFLSIIMRGPGPDRAALGALLAILGIGLLVFALVLFLYFLDLLARTRTTIMHAAEGRV